MANIKNSKKDSVPNKILYSRMSYIHQAVMYLATKQQKSAANAEQVVGGSMDSKGSGTLNTKTFEPIARRLVSDLRNVSQKGTIRMSPQMKRSMCKNCDTVLIEGSTCSTRIENESKGGKKPWADMLMRKCNTCGFTKRYPVAAERQKRRPHRVAKAVDSAMGEQAD